MATRIYALAKELKVDSKELVDVCAKAGITGKGSALASLSDEEVDKLRNFLATPSSTAGRAKPSNAPAAPERPSSPAARTGKMPVINTSRPKSPLAGIRKSAQSAAQDTDVEELMAEDEAMAEELDRQRAEAHVEGVAAAGDQA